MAKARQRQIDNRRERREGREITLRWTIVAQSQRGEEDEEERWLKNINQAQRRQAKRARRGNYTPPTEEVVVIDPPENEEAPEPKKDTAPIGGKVVTGQPGKPIGEKWFEGMKNVQPRRPWLFAILILPIIAVVTLLVSFLTAYKKFFSAHP